MRRTMSLDQELNLIANAFAVYKALALAVQDPVVIPNPQDIQEGEAINLSDIDTSHVYFYAEEDEGLEVMRERINYAGKDIKEAYKAHAKMEDIFAQLEDCFVEEKVVMGNFLLKGLYNFNLKNYADFVKVHKEQFGEKAFLEYPYFRGGFESVGRNIVSISAFNPKRTYEDWIESVAKLERLHKDLIPSLIWKEMRLDNRVGSYKEGLDLTKMLLKEHLDFDVEV